jgi:hypothetical protein
LVVAGYLGSSQSSTQKGVEEMFNGKSRLTSERFWKVLAIAALALITAREFVPFHGQEDGWRFIGVSHAQGVAVGGSLVFTVSSDGKTLYQFQVTTNNTPPQFVGSAATP